MFPHLCAASGIWEIFVAAANKYSLSSEHIVNKETRLTDHVSQSNVQTTNVVSTYMCAGQHGGKHHLCRRLSLPEQQRREGTGGDDEKRLSVSDEQRTEFIKVSVEETSDDLSRLT